MRHSNLPIELEPETNEHPLPEQLLMRQAVKESLTTIQRNIWEMYNYDRLTQNEIAKRYSITQEAISQRIGTIERRLMKYCKEHKKLIKAINEASK